MDQQKDLSPLVRPWKNRAPVKAWVADPIWADNRWPPLRYKPTQWDFVEAKQGENGQPPFPFCGELCQLLFSFLAGLVAFSHSYGTWGFPGKGPERLHLLPNWFMVIIELFCGTTGSHWIPLLECEDSMTWGDFKNSWESGIEKPVDFDEK